MPMEKILIIGASKGIGLEVVKQALALGYSVRALARSADKIALSDQKLEKRNGSALNAKDVSSALEGVDAVVLTLGIPAGPQMVLGPVRLFSEATRIIVPAMEEAGVRRLICVTGFGAGDSRASIGCLQGIAFRLFFGHAYNDKDIQESLIRRSHLDWVIVRPVVLTGGPKSGRYKVLDDPKLWRNGLISRADVADFLIRQISSDSYLGKTPVLTW
jgi:putative NADH-flavin reductase